MSPKDGVRIFAKLEDQEPDRVGQGPRRALDGRGRRGVGRARARPADPRADERQHRHRAGHDRQGQGYPVSVVMPESATPERVELLQACTAPRSCSRPASRVRTARSRWPANSRSAIPSSTCRSSTRIQRTRSAHYCGTAARDPANSARRAGRRVRRRPRHRRHADGRRAAGCARQTRTCRSSRPSRCRRPGDRACDRSRTATPPILDIRELDRKVLVPTSRRCARCASCWSSRSIFAGVSAGAALAVARRIGADRGGPTSSRCSRTAAASTWRRTLHRSRSRSSSGRWRSASGVIPAAMRDEIVAHAKAGLPNEACGIIAGLRRHGAALLPRGAGRAKPGTTTGSRPRIRSGS